MACTSFDKIIENPKFSDAQRKEALVNLVRDGCLRSLFKHASSYSRIQWIREFALLALVKFAVIKKGENSIVLGNENIVLNNNLNLDKKRLEAARYLFVFLNNEKRPRKMRITALLGLIKGHHLDYCRELLNDPSVERWIKIKIKESGLGFY